VLRAVLRALPDVLARPVANLERIAVVKHDGDLLEPLPMIRDPATRTRRVDGAAGLHAPVRPPAAGALHDAHAPAARGGRAGRDDAARRVGILERRAPFGDRFGTIASHVPTYTVFVDRPGRIAALWPTVDEITASTGWSPRRSCRPTASAPGTSSTAAHGAQQRRGRQAVSPLRQSDVAQGPTVPTAVPPAGGSAEDEWARRLVDEIRDFARTHDRPRRSSA
jgi:hypothetical protein